MKFDVNDIVGKEFGKLTVLKYSHSIPCKSKRGYFHYYSCKCQCGNIKLVERSNLLSRKTKSCGCSTYETNIKRLYKHGKRYSRINNIWRGLKQRCYNPKRIQYKYYGEKGIKICQEWLNDFQTFYDWAIANGYQENLTIDRINRDGNYEPSNCRWVTWRLQANNKQNVPLYSYKGLKLSIAEWSRRYNMDTETLRERIKYYGWSIEKALTTPVRSRNPK